MNVWIVNQYAIPPSQAGGTRHHGLAKALIARGHQVVLIAADLNYTTQTASRLAPDEKWRLETLDGVPYVWLRVPPYAGNSVGRVLSMRAFARDVLAVPYPMPAPDVVIGSSPHLFAADAARKLAKRFKAPFVLEVRDLWPQSLVDVAGLSPYHPLVLALGWLERRLYRQADAILTLLPGARDHIVARGGKASAITWLPNGIDLGLAGPVTPLPEGEFTLLYAGAHGVANGLDALVDAAALLKDDPVRFRFLGEGPEKARLLARTRMEGLDKVSFEPAVAKAEIYTELAKAHAFWLTLRDTDLYKHGISLNKLYDYLAMGRPTVFGARALNNPIAEADAGLVVPPEDGPALAVAVRQLLALSPAERAAMGAHGRRFVEREHDVAGLAERLEGVLLAVAKGGNV